MLYVCYIRTKSKINTSSVYFYSFYLFIQITELSVYEIQDEYEEEEEEHNEDETCLQNNSF